MLKEFVRKENKHKIKAATFLVVAAFLVTGALYFRMPQKVVPVEETSKTVVEQVASLIQLPAGEPDIVTVTDKTKLSEQTFFTSLENGDQILIFKEAKRVIVYRPSIKKIIKVAPVATNKP
jgi:archaellum component FlaF (FlaF/FlaG flagellin family)